jgi:glycosyltransferase involved in cell wall biosynthesis
MEIQTTKTIGIDARFYGPTGKGLGRYTQEIVDNVIKIDQVNNYVVFLTADNFDEFECDGKRIKKVLANVRWYTLAEQFIMPRLIKQANVDLMHYLHFNVPVFSLKRFVVTIHDLILIKYPTPRASTLSPMIYKIKNLLYRIIIWLAVHRAEKIIAVSKFTKQDIVKHFKINPKKIVMIYEGVANLAKGRDSLFAAKQNDKEVILEYNIASPFLLYIGNAYPHKNLERLILVFQKIKEDNTKFADLKLVLVGKEDYFYKRLKQGTKDDAVVFAGYVPDSKLEAMFNQAICYIFPSLYEGFGLPPLEAMAKGCPVAAADRSCLPEVLGEAAIYFNPENEADMQAKIENLINNQTLRVQLIEEGYKQIKKYDWWESARQTVQIYQALL